MSSAVGDAPDPAPGGRAASALGDRRRARRRQVVELAEGQAGVASRPQLYAAGVTRAEVRANLAACRWRRLGRQTVCVYTGPLGRDAQLWAAVLEAGPRAFLDGASALEAAGLTGFDAATIRVSVPRGARVRRARGLDIRQTRRWRAGDRASTNPPRSRAEVAAVRAALWAASDKQAALLLTMSVQQGLTTPQLIGRELLSVRRDRRRPFVQAVVLDLMEGSRALGEAEVARECRDRGLPEPSRQVVRRVSEGRYVVDILWEEWGVAVEVDGIQHSWAQQVVSDALRQNSLTLVGLLVLRLPLLGLRVAPDDFFAQIERALVARGCPIGGAVRPSA